LLAHIASVDACFWRYARRTRRRKS
jgi:hypothetical protein